MPEQCWPAILIDMPLHKDCQIKVCLTPSILFVQNCQIFDLGSINSTFGYLIRPNDRSGKFSASQK